MAGLLTGLVCLGLTGFGFVRAWRSLKGRRYTAATRWFAAGLVPLGLWMTGLATLSRRVGTALADWATGFVFGPQAWVGVGVLGFAVVLFVVARAVGGGKDGKDGKDASSADVLGGSAGTSGLGGSPASRGALPPSTAAPKRRGRGSSAAGTEFDEIEEILRRRGI